MAPRGHTGDNEVPSCFGDAQRAAPDAGTKHIPSTHPPPLSLLPEPDTPAKAKKNKGNNCTATGKATLRETELTGWKSQESELPSPTWEQRIAPFRTSAGVIISSAQGFVLASYADKSLIYGHLI